MMVFREQTDPPPPLALTDEKQVKLKVEALASDDHWVKEIIDGLRGVLREAKD